MVGGGPLVLPLSAYPVPKDSTADLQKGQSFAIVWQIVRQFAGWTRGDRVGGCGEFRRVIRQWYIILSFKDVPKSEVLRAARVPRSDALRAGSLPA